MQPKLIIAFAGLSLADLLARGASVVEATRDNPYFPHPWPAQVPSHEYLEQVFNAYRSAMLAAEDGSRTRITEREAAKADLIDKLRAVAAYLEVVAAGDVAKLQTTGFELRRDTTRTGGRGPLPAPSGFRLTRGDLGGVLIAHATRLLGATGYECWTTDGDPTQEDGWRFEGSHSGCKAIVIERLTPGKTYWVRLRAFNGNGPGAWTDTAHLMVV